MQHTWSFASDALSMQTKGTSCRNNSQGSSTTRQIRSRASSIHILHTSATLAASFLEQCAKMLPSNSGVESTRVCAEEFILLVYTERPMLVVAGKRKSQSTR